MSTEHRQNPDAPIVHDTFAGLHRSNPLATLAPVADKPGQGAPAGLPSPLDLTELEYRLRDACRLYGLTWLQVGVSEDPRYVTYAGTRSPAGTTPPIVAHGETLDDMIETLDRKEAEADLASEPPPAPPTEAEVDEMARRDAAEGRIRQTPAYPNPHD